MRRALAAVAPLMQPVITTNGAGQCVCVSLQDADGQIKQVLWEAQLMQAKVLEGWKLVPIEPTGAMLLNCVGICRSAEDASRAYKAMLAAAPEVQS
jgi:hypothetical protein